MIEEISRKCLVWCSLVAFESIVDVELDEANPGHRESPRSVAVERVPEVLQVLYEFSERLAALHVRQFLL